MSHIPFAFGDKCPAACGNCRSSSMTSACWCPPEGAPGCICPEYYAEKKAKETGIAIDLLTEAQREGYCLNCIIGPYRPRESGWKRIRHRDPANCRLTHARIDGIPVPDWAARKLRA